MKILGIGNAIVDVICKVNDQYLINNQLTKSTMKLVDENEFQKLLSTLKIEQTISGGSVANSIVGLSQLGNDVGFIGKVNDDNLGQKYQKLPKGEEVEEESMVWDAYLNIQAGFDRGDLVYNEDLLDRLKDIQSDINRQQKNNFCHNRLLQCSTN